MRKTVVLLFILCACSSFACKPVYLDYKVSDACAKAEKDLVLAKGANSWHCEEWERLDCKNMSKDPSTGGDLFSSTFQAFGCQEYEGRCGRVEEAQENLKTACGEK